MTQQLRTILEKRGNCMHSRGNRSVSHAARCMHGQKTLSRSQSHPLRKFRNGRTDSKYPICMHTKAPRSAIFEAKRVFPHALQYTIIKRAAGQHLVRPGVNHNWDICKTQIREDDEEEDVGRGKRESYLLVRSKKVVSEAVR